MRLAAAVGLRLAERLDERGDVVAVDLARVPAERLELGGDVAEIAHLLGGAVDLQPVAVDDGDQVVKLAMGGEHGRLPHLALLALAVAQQREHRLGLAVELEARGGAGGDGEALAERSGGHLDAGDLVGIGMALQAAAQLA